VQRFASELVRQALALNGDGPNFTTDIVPDTARGTGKGIAGSVVNLLTVAHVIEPVGITGVDGTWYQHRVKSKRESCKARFLDVHRLASVGAAREFLRRNGVAVLETAVQEELL